MTRPVVLLAFVLALGAACQESPADKALRGRLRTYVTAVSSMKYGAYAPVVLEACTNIDAHVSEFSRLKHADREIGEYREGCLSGPPAYLRAVVEHGDLDGGERSHPGACYGARQVASVAPATPEVAELRRTVDTKCGPK